METIDFCDDAAAQTVRAMIAARERFTLLLPEDARSDLERSCKADGSLDIGSLTTSRIGLLAGFVSLAVGRGFSVQATPGERTVAFVAPSRTPKPAHRVHESVAGLGTELEHLSAATVFSADEAERRQRLFESWQKRGWMPVADDGSGNYFVILPDGPAAFVDTMAGQDQLAYVVATSLPKLLELLRRGISPFDRDQVLAIDPSLAELRHLAPLPWET